MSEALMFQERIGNHKSKYCKKYFKNIVNIKHCFGCTTTDN